MFHRLVKSVYVNLQNSYQTGCERSGGRVKRNDVKSTAYGRTLALPKSSDNLLNGSPFSGNLHIFY
jgi:hypothetical protein